MGAHRPPRNTLHAVRERAHWLVDRAAFGVETVLLAFGFFVLGTVAFFDGNGDLVVHEWALFLTHYASAAAEARRPVNEVLAVIALALAAFVAVCRWKAARLVWAAQKGRSLRGG